MVIILADFRDAHKVLVHWHSAVHLDCREESSGLTPVKTGDKSFLRGLSL